MIHFPCAFVKTFCNGWATTEFGCGATSPDDRLLYEKRSVPQHDCDENSVRCRLLSSESRIIEGVRVAPAPRLRIEDAGGESPVIEDHTIDLSVYAQDHLLPKEPVALRYTGYMRDRHVASIEIHPVRYNPAKSALLVHERMRIAIEFRPSRTGRAQRASSTRRGPYGELIERSVLSTPNASALSNPGWLPVKAGGEVPGEVKVELESDGIYRIGREDLEAAGYDAAGVDSRRTRQALTGSRSPASRMRISTSST